MGRRLALLIANNIFEDEKYTSLHAPLTDVESLAKVLEDPNVGGFEILPFLINEPKSTIEKQIERVFKGEEAVDMLLLYFSSHGAVTSNTGSFYVAGKDTHHESPVATGISSTTIYEMMEASNAKQKILILDCCYSGAALRRAKGETNNKPIIKRTSARGRVTLTASGATEVAWEVKDEIQGLYLSVFTKYLIQGLETGDADYDGDGNIDIDELYDYTYHQVRQVEQDQTPVKHVEKQQGKIIIAKSKKGLRSPEQLKGTFLNEESRYQVHQDLGGDRKSQEQYIMNKQQNNPQKPLKLFFSYTRKDRPWLEELKKHLTILVQQGYLQTWDDSQIHPGDIWAETINMNLLNSDIVLFLITPDYMGSDYAFTVEARTILRRLSENKVIGIPVILSTADWKNSPLVELKPLPKSGQPLTEWTSPADGFSDIVEGIRDICQKLVTQHSTSTTSMSSLSMRLKFDEVFVKSGTPGFTFVEYPNFKLLKFAIAKPGRGVVIEGPSGIGKTTAVKKAIEELVLSSQTQFTPVKVLSARFPEHIQEIQTLQQWHKGTVVIDDFHRLDEALRQSVVDYLKYLADIEPESKKLVVVGIPYTRHKLVSLSFDLATRIDIFSLGRISDYDVQTMIEKGEKALNIRFDEKAEIVRAASGSLNIAQYICYTICSLEEIVEAQAQLRWVSYDIKTAIASVMADLSMKFDETLHKFAHLGGPRNSITLRLLEELARSEEGLLSLSVLKKQRPDLTLGIDHFINEKWIDDLYQDYPVSKYFIFFDQKVATLVADDPQLIFYLKKTRFSQLAKEMGKVTSLAQCKVFISYSHKDTQWLNRLQVHLKPIEQEEVIDLWADTKITANVVWEDKFKEALDVARVALVLVSADFLASDFVIKHKLPKLLSNASSSGTIIIPIILSPCLFKRSKLAIFQSVNSPDSPLSSLDHNAQEMILMRIAEVVSDYLENGEA